MMKRLWGWITKPLGWVRAARNSKRDIFSYDVNGKTVYADPLAIEARLIASIGDDWASLATQYVQLGQDMPALPPDMRRSRAAKRIATLEKLLKGVRDAFFVTDLMLDGSGLTRAEQLALLVSYVEWIASAKEDVIPFAPSPARESASA